MLTFMQLLQPKSLEEAYEMVIANKMAPLLAGGCWTRLGRRRWPKVIDLGGLGLRYITETDVEYRVGAMTTQRDMEQYAPWQTFAGGVLPKSVSSILGLQFRNMATIGGSVAAKFGFSDIIPVLLALGADVVLHQAGRMSLESYLSFTERDILVEICIPKQAPQVALEALRKSVSDFPYLTGAIRRDGNEYAVYIGARPGVAKKAVKASAILTEKGLAGAEEAAQLAAEELLFQTNSHASQSYRQQMTIGMVKRLAKEVQ